MSQGKRGSASISPVHSEGRGERAWTPESPLPGPQLRQQLLVHGLMHAQDHRLTQVESFLHLRRSVHMRSMVALVSPVSPPPSAYFSIFAWKLATLNSERSPKIIVNVAPAAGFHVTLSFMSSCIRKYPWTSTGSRARRSVLTNRPLQLTTSDRLTIEGEGGFRNPVELHGVVHLEALPPWEGDHLRHHHS